MEGILSEVAGAGRIDCERLEEEVAEAFCGTEKEEPAETPRKENGSWEIGSPVLQHY